MRACLLPPMLMYKPASSAGKQRMRAEDEELRQLLLFQLLQVADPSQALAEHDSVSTFQSLFLLSWNP